MTGRARLRVATTAVMLGALTLAGCGGDGSTSDGSGSGAGKPLRIGISLSLTGDFADPGKAAKRGYDLWAQEVNRKGGILDRKVELKIVDDASQPNQVVTNYQTLITKDRVDLVFGGFSTLLTVPASQVAARYKYAFLEPAGGGPKVFEQKLNNLFFVQPAPAVKQGDIFAKYILSLPPAQRPKTAAYPALDDPFASPIAEDVRRQFEAAGIRTVYAQIYPAKQTDLTPVVSRMMAAKPDVVVAGTQVEDAYAMVKSMIQLKFAPKWLYMSNGASSPVEFPDKVGAENVNGVFTSGDWFPATKAFGNQAFIKAYLAKYGGEASGIDTTSAEAYSCGMLLEQVAEKTGKIDNATVIKTLHSGTWRTLVGDLSWDATGAPKGSYLLVQWIDGKLTPVFPADQAQHEPVTDPLAWAD